MENFYVSAVYLCVKGIENMVECFFNKSSEKQDPTCKMAFHGLLFIVKIILWISAMLLVLSNLGVEITYLFASLGIGGMAVALALQNILGDVFSSFTIYFDKPFRIGDFITVGEYSGVVKKIGIKTTRFQTLQGEELVISNNELTSSKIQNFKKLTDRRVVEHFGFVYGSFLKDLKKNNSILKKIVDSVDGVDFDRSHFVEFGDFSLKFELVYIVHSSDYTEYLNVKQEINFQIKQNFEEENIQMAFPTQTIYLEK